MDRLRTQKIRTQVRASHGEVELTGWLQGKHTYLWIGNDHGYGIVDGQPLYRLAKAIVARFEDPDGQG